MSPEVVRKVGSKAVVVSMAMRKVPPCFGESFSLGSCPDVPFCEQPNATRQKTNNTAIKILRFFDIVSLLILFGTITDFWLKFA